MTLDVYSPCPGGFDRKVKFCCKDLVSSLDQIMTQLDGDQVQGALRSIDRQLALTPDRACLLALKVDALHAAGRDEEVAAVVDELCRLHPDNPISLACRAVQRC